jgi:hypothetical protein
MQALAALEQQSPAVRLPAEFLRTFGGRGLDLAAAVAATSAAAATARLEDLAAGVATGCAGVFLLIRAMLDARLASVARQAGYPLAPCILAMGLCWGGPRAAFQGRLDTGIGLLAGQGSDMPLEELRDIWRHVDASRHFRFQSGMLDVLASRGVLAGRLVEVHRLKLKDGHTAIVCGNSRLWPLARIVDSEAEDRDSLAAMAETWREATGDEPEFVPAPEESVLALRDALAALGADWLDLPLADLTLSLAALSLLRLWAGWLRQFSTSSVPYLLQNFIRRPGRIVKTGDGLLVEMARLPLDIVIDMAGYAAPFHARTEPWECRVAFGIPSA